MTGKTCIAALFSLMLVGCISLMPEAGPGPDIYRLSAVLIPSTSGNPQTMVLLPVVAAPRELKNNRVALVRGSQSIAYAAAARWASSTPEMLQVQIADSIRAHGRIGVVLPADGVDAEFQVQVTLRSFEARYDHGVDAAPMGVVEYRVQVISRKTRKLIGEQTFGATRRSSDLTLGSIVHAIDGASSETSIAMADWLAGQIAE